MKRRNCIWIFCLILLITCTSWFNLSSQIVLQRCDKSNLWKSSNTITVDAGNKKEGVASLSFTGSGTDWFKKKFSQTDAGIDETGWFCFWLYVSDVSKISGDGQIELTSSGIPDNNEFSWPLSAVVLVNGWNLVKLPLSSAGKIGTPSLNSINYFRIYQPVTGEITAKIDFLRFTNSETPVYSTDPLDKPKIDFTTLDGKVMFGYQGWFFHPDDGSEFARWVHWGNLQDENTIDVEMFPDMREYESDEKFESGLTYSDGRIARVYSAYNEKTVMRHMKWLRDYSLDGVFVQRFIVSVNDANLKKSLDTVMNNVKKGCEKYDRAFVNMWDLSGMLPGQMSRVIDDWKHLVDDLKITESPNYLRHRGKPLVSIWGFTVRDLPESDLQQLINFFRNSPEEKYRATIMLGTNHDFFLKTSWLDELKQVDVISPWAVGRFNSISGNQSFITNYVVQGQDWCDLNNIDFLPIVWPGFSWYNLQREGDWQKNQIKRDGGNFYWAQANRTISSNAKMIYIAMFDEVDESTAMFKIAENKAQAPNVGYWLTLDADGYKLPSDWYLRCAKLTTEVLQGVTDNRSSLGTPPDGIDEFRAEAISTKCATTMGKLIFSYPLVNENSLLDFSIDGGISFIYHTPPGSSSFESEPLSSGIYSVWVRRTDGSFPTDLGSYTVFDIEPGATATATNATCGLVDGAITLIVNDNPYLGPLKLSTDGGTSYNTTTVEGTWVYNLEGFAPETYNLWLKWADESCAKHMEDLSISSDPIPITLSPTIDEEPQGQIASNVIYVCPGSSLSITAEPAENSWVWSWTGPNSYSASSRTVLISDSISTAMLGKYELSYINPVDKCEKNYFFYVRKLALCPSVNIADFNNEKGLRVFPNPTKGSFRIESGQEGIVYFEICDLSGRKIFTKIILSEEDNNIDISAFESGVYVYKIVGKSGDKKYGKILKEQ